jgi:hypothetical protein
VRASGSRVAIALVLKCPDHLRVRGLRIVSLTALRESAPVMAKPCSKAQAMLPAPQVSRS